MTLTLLPAVDVAGGQAVRLVQGAAGTETSYGDPLAAALAWQSAGAAWIHLVDLDGAFGRGSNAALLAKVVGRLDVAVELSGGIRDDESLAAALATGCARVNVGTAALERPDAGAAVLQSPAGAEGSLLGRIVPVFASRRKAAADRQVASAIGQARAAIDSGDRKQAAKVLESVTAFAEYATSELHDEWQALNKKTSKGRVFRKSG